MHIVCTLTSSGLCSCMQSPCIVRTIQTVLYTHPSASLAQSKARHSQRNVTNQRRQQVAVPDCHTCSAGLAQAQHSVCGLRRVQRGSKPACKPTSCCRRCRRCRRCTTPPRTPCCSRRRLHARMRCQTMPCQVTRPLFPSCRCGPPSPPVNEPANFSH